MKPQAMTHQQIDKILIANRGEIAVRIIQTARRLNIQTVAVYAHGDRDSAHVALADEALSLGEGSVSHTYLNLDRLKAAIQRSQADALHPGYGFLSESPALARLCRELKIKFIGPTPEAIERMGDKIRARHTAQEAQIPVLQAATGTVEEILAQKQSLRYPLLVKASAGGGGKGMRIVNHKKDLEEGLRSAARESKKFFANPAVYVETYIPDARHLEVQVLADHHGNRIHLWERECSLQRRYQKVIEEAPSPTANNALRKALTDSALKLAKAINYTSAGTVEFLTDRDNNHYFLEMNTRIQVEHPVTEMITGIDLVEQQIRIAQDMPLSYTQEQIPLDGHAIEARLYAEDPGNNYLPAPGPLEDIHFPEMAGVRTDHALKENDYISADYDPMIAKVSAHGESRQQATSRLVKALKNTTFTGTQTNLELLGELLQSLDFRHNNLSTQYLERETPCLMKQLRARKNTLNPALLVAAYVFKTLYREKPTPAINNTHTWQSIGYWRIRPSITVQLGKNTYTVQIQKENNHYLLHMGQHTISGLCTRRVDNDYMITMDHKSYTFKFIEKPGHQFIIKHNGYYYLLQRPDLLQPSEHLPPEDMFSGNGSPGVISPLHGRVISVNRNTRDTVLRGDPLVIIESMKTENVVRAPATGEIINIFVSPGDRVEAGKVLMELKEGSPKMAKSKNK